MRRKNKKTQRGGMLEEMEQEKCCSWRATSLRRRVKKTSARNQKTVERGRAIKSGKESFKGRMESASRAVIVAQSDRTIAKQIRVRGKRVWKPQKMSN